ncbi:hypothetical protein IWQ62_003294 [Dispira parvispora]|uniref:Seipin n=1 Tax=Dispira parvispora TaxID=1520584 RepID=A0A9W8E6F0_9FUNG|nr:hypothetical protein IWQ62_003294 [Dispira parvispora]
MALELPFLTRPVHLADLKRWLVHGCLAVLALLAMGCVAILAYAALYYVYIPPLSHEFPVYLQYPVVHYHSPPSVLPAWNPAVAYVALDSLDNGGSVLHSGQVYQVTLTLTVPRSPANRQLGNFMVGLDLRNAANATVGQAIRPVLLKYESTLMRTVSSMLWMIPLALGWVDEAHTIPVALFDSISFTRYDMATHALLTLNDPRVQTYLVTLRFDAKFSGLRYWMYYWSLTSAVIFVLLSVLWQMGFGILSWRVLSKYTQITYPPVDMSESADQLLEDDADTIQRTRAPMDSLHRTLSSGDGNDDVLSE